MNNTGKNPLHNSGYRPNNRVSIAATVLFFAVVSFFFFNFGPRSGDHPSGYTYYRGITIDHTKVSGSTDLEGFPVLISIQDNDYSSISNGGNVESENGYDIIFTDDGGNQLAHQIERYDASSGEILAWVRVTNLSASENTILRIYYGNKNINSEQSTSITWKSDYKTAFHFENNPLISAPQLTDGTSNAVSATKFGTTDSLNFVDGIVGNAWYFDGNDDYLNCSQDLGIWLGKTATFSAWIKTNNQPEQSNYKSMPGITGVSALLLSTNEIFYGIIDDNGKIGGQAGNTSGAFSSQSVVDDNWHHVVITRESADGKIRVYIDGSLSDSASSSSGSISNAFYDIGRVIGNLSSSNYFKGTIDELRIYDGILNEHWIATEYNNIQNPFAFYEVSQRYSVIDTTIEESVDNSNIEFLPNYCKRIHIRIKGSEVCGSADFVSFPLFVNVEREALKSISNGGSVADSNGYDIVFTSKDGKTLLSFQTEDYDPLLGKFSAWVMLPELSATENTDIFMYYGNSDANTNLSSNIWDSDYKAVWHMSSNPASSDLLDNGYYSHNGTFEGGMSSSNLVDGILGKAIQFDGIDDYVNIGMPAQLKFVGNKRLTISGWAKIDNSINVGDASADIALLAKSKDVNEEKYLLGLDKGEKLKVGIGTNRVSHTTVNQGNVALDEWQYLAMTFNNAKLRGFVNGVEVFSEDVEGNMINHGQDIFFIAKRHDNRYFKGLIDELRVLQAVRSEEWICTEYKNQSAPLEFYTLGDEENCNSWADNKHISPNRWKGTESIDWFDTLNWTMHYVPTENDSAVIPGNTPFDPLVESGKTAKAKTLILHDENTLTIENNALFRLYGDAHIMGDIVNTAGKFVFSGSSTQNLYGPHDVEVYNAAMENSSGLQLHTNFGIANNLNFQSGMIFTNSDTVKILSDSEEAISGYNKNNYVAGYLNRKINDGYTDYMFPVGKGNENNYHWVLIEAKKLKGTSNITIHLTDIFNHDDSDVFILDLGMSIRSLNKACIWVIEPDVQPTSGSYNIRLCTENMSGLEDNSFSVVKRPHGSDATNWSTGGGTLNLLLSLGRKVSDGFSLLNNLTSFSDFGVGQEGEGDALPIKLSYFRAELWDDKSVMLTWETYTEINNDYFTIEHSTDGSAFAPIGKVQGAGNSTDILSYEFLHENAEQGENYYRLKQTDYDGQFEYFDIKSVYLEAGGGIDDIYVDRVGPNPFNSELALRYFSSGVRIMSVKMYNLSGAIVLAEEHSAHVGSNKIQLSGLSSLSQGTYLLEITDNNTYSETVKVIKSY
ncbi:MAG: DUF2341 domain-containing protein [Chitinophagales bacterium]